VSFHGFDNLVGRYGTASIARVFKSLLQSTCRTPLGWDTANFGPGIVDARALLAAPLPDAPPARKLRDPQRAAIAMDATGLETFVHLMPDVPRAQVERGLAAILHISDRQLPRALQDVGDELAFQLVMHPQLEKAVRLAGLPTARPATATRAAGMALPSGAASTRLRVWIRRSPRSAKRI
jgi:hypothetical protein